jgi:hypothetical protein
MTAKQGFTHLCGGHNDDPRGARNQNVRAKYFSQAALPLVCLLVQRVEYQMSSWMAEPSNSISMAAGSYRYFEGPPWRPVRMERTYKCGIAKTPDNL